MVLPIYVTVLALNPPASVLQAETEQRGVRKASRIWPHAVRVPADIGLTEMFLPFCGRRGFPSCLTPASPSRCPGRSGMAEVAGMNLLGNASPSGHGSGGHGLGSDSHQEMGQRCDHRQLYKLYNLLLC